MKQNSQENGSPSKLVFKDTQSCIESIEGFDTKNEIKKIKADEVRLVGMKCRCGSSWCPICSKQRWAPSVAERLKAFDWQRTRQIVLTIDRKQFETGQEAYEHVKQKKMLPQLIHNLRRTKGIAIENWLWVLEWHKDGYPHWHLFAEVDKPGAAGKIYFENIKQYWGIGNVNESYIKTKKHWDDMTGYFGRKGYFEKKKAHQARLPMWALDHNKAIRRLGAMQHWAPNVAKKLTSFDWQKTCQIDLKIDRTKFKSGKEAYEHVQQEKMLSEFISNLKKTKGVVINNWLWVLEWDRDGFPHWHLFVEPEKEGTTERIRFENIKQYWGIGDVNESHIETKKHWDEMTVCFGQKGYFEEEKAHHVKLPRWALDHDNDIRRFGAMRLNKSQSEKDKKNEDKKAGSESETDNVEQTSETQIKEKERETYKEIIDACGSRTNICVDRGFKTWQTFNIPYRQFRKEYIGDYVEGQGYVVGMSLDDFFNFAGAYGRINAPPQYNKQNA